MLKQQQKYSYSNQKFPVWEMDDDIESINKKTWRIFFPIHHKIMINDISITKRTPPKEKKKSFEQLLWLDGAYVNRNWP